MRDVRDDYHHRWKRCFERTDRGGEKETRGSKVEEWVSIELPNGDSERERSGEYDQYHVQNETAEEVILMRRKQKEKGREQQTTGCRGARSFEGLLNTARVSSAAKAFSRSLSRRERSVVRETETPEDGQHIGRVE